MPLARLTVRMLRPLPGNSGHQCEQIPITSPAPASAGTSTQLRIRRAGLRRCHEPVERQPHHQCHRRQHQPVSGQQIGRLLDRPVAGWADRRVTAEPIATARLEVRNAAPSARGCQVFSKIRAENSAPASGTA